MIPQKIIIIIIIAFSYNSNNLIFNYLKSNIPNYI